MDQAMQAESTQWIGVSAIDVPEHFRQHQPEAMAMLEQDIKERGLLQEIVVAPKAEGRYELVAGNGRLTAVKKLGWDKIRAQVLPAAIPELDKTMITIVENEDREDVSPIDRGLSYQRAIDAGGITQDELATRRGLDKTTMSQYLSLARLSKDVRQKFGRPNLGLAHLTEIRRLPNTEDQLKLANEVSEQGLSSKEVRARVNQLLGKTPTDEKSPHNPPLAKGGQRGFAPGFHFAWKGDKLAVKGLWAAKGKGPATLSQELQAALSDFLAEHPAPEKTELKA